MTQTLLPEYQQRVLDELNELEARTHRLYDFFHTKLYESLDPAEQQRLTRQHDLMTQYAEVLHERILAFPPVSQ